VGTKLNIPDPQYQRSEPVTLARRPIDVISGNQDMADRGPLPEWLFKIGG
jgi:hypothetical protein